MRLLVALVTGLSGLAVTAVAACRSGDGEAAVQAESRTAAIYAAVITEIAADNPPATDRDRSRRPLFVEGAGGYEVPIEVQVEVVNELKDTEPVRFIDERAEAVRIADDDEPVRNDGVLIVLHPVAVDEDPVTVTADRYLRLDEVLRHRFTLELDGDEDVEVVGEPTTTPTTFAPTRRSGRAGG
ncbi:MAG: hypothetical protein ACRDY7_16670 [Acidimicrobiia bacterium]